MKEEMENKAIMHGEPARLPKEYDTLAGMLMHVAAEYPQKGLTYIDSRGNEDFVSYSVLADSARKKLSALRERGVKPKDRLILVIDQSKEFYQAYWACIFGGMIPAPVSQPSSWEEGADGLKKLSRIWEILDKPKLLIEEKNRKDCEKLANTKAYKGLEYLVVEDTVSEKVAEIYSTKADDMIFLQFSSGSTGLPKGVQLTNRNIITNLVGLSEKLGVTEQDNSFTWVPHTHDMGLFVQHLTPMMKGSNIMVFSPYTFVRNPYLFLSKITQLRGSWFCSTNFGFDWMSRNIPEEKLASLDLSSLRFALNGAEPISVIVTESFIEKFKKCGFRETMMLPSYGMAEATVGISIPKLGEVPEIIRARRTKLVQDKLVVGCTEVESDRVEFYQEGSALAGVSIRIADDEGNTLSEDQVGEVQVKGDSVTCGYYNSEEVNRRVFCGEWLRTGDLGFMENGKLVITGRKKDIIFVRGQNYYSHDLEEVIYRHGLVPRGNLVCAGCFHSRSQKEEILLFVKDRLKAEKFQTLRQAIIGQMYESLGLDITHVIPVRAIPKTTSGKVQRYQLVKQYENGEYDQIISEVEGALKAKDHKDNVTDNSELTEFLHKSWAELLEISPDTFTNEDSIRVMGGTSIKLYQLLSRLENHLGCDVGMEAFQQCSTINQLAEYAVNLLRNGQANSKKHAGKVLEKSGPVAVTGIAFRLPGAKNQVDFWNNLQNKKDCITRVSLERQALTGENDWNDWIGEVEHIDSFDHDFFGMSRDEALFMDPQQRLILETAYEALEDAGVVTESEDERPIGVYAGVNWNGYSQLVCDYVNQMGTGEVHQNALVRNLNNIAAAEVAHQFNFTGPVLAIDTACSSFLTGVHHGVKAIQGGDIDGAVVAGAVLMVNKTVHMLAENAGILSSTSQSKVFDKDADGSILGEGVIVAFLEPLSAAVKGNKQIYGVIHGTAINNDGYSLGIMAPNPKGQFQVLEKAYQDANLSPAELTYLEAHGTGTTIGDPIEINALSKLFASYEEGPEKESIGIGSVKTNIGHLLPAAGGASLVKVLLSLKNKKLPPSLHMDHINPALELEKTPFQVITETKAWNPGQSGERIAGITSLGLGGTNAHIIVGEWDGGQEGRSSEKEASLLTISAKTEKALDRMIHEMQDHLKTVDQEEISNICFTRNRYRKHYEYRAAFLVQANKKERKITMIRGKRRRMKMEVLVSKKSYGEDRLPASCTWEKSLENLGIHVSDTDGEKKLKLNQLCIELAGDDNAPVTLVSPVGRDIVGGFENTGPLPDRGYLLRIIARLYVQGINPEWEKMHPDGSGRMVNIPAYSFEKNSVWIRLPAANV